MFAENIINTIKNSNSIILIFITKTSNDPKFKIGKIYINETIYNNIKDLYIPFIENSMKNKNESEFDPMIDNDDIVYFLHNTEIKGINDILNPLNDVAAIESSPFKKMVNESDAFAFVFSHNEQKVICLRKMNSSYSLKNKNILFSDNDRISKFDQELFVLDNKIDCIIFGEKTYIIGKYNFELLFSYDSVYLNTANISLNKLNNFNVISNFESFKEDCLSRNRIIRRLYKIEKEGFIDKFIDCIQNEGIRLNMIEAIKILQLNFEIVNNQIAYEDVSCLTEILNFISNDYLRSFYTNDTFIAATKTEYIRK
ncbi:MAG: DUF4868 domain-containing protein [Caloramator sp.]|nr:DUF4868 domain-containing protein [Caloramator sp.]